MICGFLCFAFLCWLFTVICVGCICTWFVVGFSVYCWVGVVLCVAWVLNFGCVAASVGGCFVIYLVNTVDLLDVVLLGG